MKRLVFWVAALGLLLGGVGKARADLILNGGFETGDLTDWTSDGFNFAATNYTTSSNFLPHSGNYFAVLGQPGFLGTLSQNVSDISGQTYVLSMYLASDGDTPNEFKVQWNNTTLFDQTNIPYSGGNPTNYALLSFAVTGTGSDTLSIGGRNDPGLLALDDVSVNPSAVPEPATLMLLGIGAAALAGCAWRRNADCQTR